MLRNEILQFFYLTLYFFTGWVFCSHLSKLSKNQHKVFHHILLILIGPVFCLFLILPILRCLSPLFLGSLCILINLLCIKYCKIHIFHSCSLNFSSEINQIFQMLLFHCKQFYLLFHCLVSVKIRCIDH